MKLKIPLHGLTVSCSSVFVEGDWRLNFFIDDAPQREPGSQGIAGYESDVVGSNSGNIQAV